MVPDQLNIDNETPSQIDDEFVLSKIPEHNFNQKRLTESIRNAAIPLGTGFFALIQSVVFFALILNLNDFESAFWLIR